MIIQIKDEPFDRWILGEGTQTGQEYLIHLGHPRFICKISDETSDDDLTVELEQGDIAHEFVFIDDEPPESEFLLLMESAVDALGRYYKLDYYWPDE